MPNKIANKKILTIPSVDRDVDQLEISYILLVGMEDGLAMQENALAGSYKYMLTI